MGKEQLLSPSNYFQKWRNYWYSVPKHHWTPILRNRKPQFNFMFTANIQIRYHLHTESIGGSINSFSQSNQFTGLSPPPLNFGALHQFIKTHVMSYTHSVWHLPPQQQLPTHFWTFVPKVRQFILSPVRSVNMPTF